MSNLPTQHKLGILQGLVVEQPVQFCPLYSSSTFGVWRSFRWKSIKRKSLKLLGTSRSFRLCYLKNGNLLVNRLHRGENANNDSIFIRYAPLTSLIDAEETKEKLPLYSKFLSMMSDSYATELRLSKKSSASNTVEKVTQYLQSH